ncbi:hypothetical protein BGZ61DRAFT_476633 [Ilyonectria robusta]|uniref:uncharacterized protein n=1 Tax=Ilyonectria robusta TaxID=1079257 RepID=UPI001E8D6E5D|nr:uncharacterized protein BGZ61DRAFT_476633 [Ilyonectria robusta]KAH8714572.1 hypothetical protein BGZ61DRAFT_476633 [Ilyonectria robusta]
MSQREPAIPAAPDRITTRLLKRDLDCDGGFTCDRGTCYRGDDGFVGCCSVSSCAPRTKCIEYADLGENGDCDHNTGGCVVWYGSAPEISRCFPLTTPSSSSAAPYCVTMTNIIMKEYAMYCDPTPDVTITLSISYDKSGATTAEATTTTTEANNESTTHESPPEITDNNDSVGDDDATSESDETGDKSINDNGTGSQNGDGDDSDADAGRPDGEGDATNTSEVPEATQTSSPDSGSSNSNRNVIIGSTAGAIGGALAALLAVWCFKRLKQKPTPGPESVRPTSSLQPQISPDMQSYLEPHYRYQPPSVMQQPSVSPTAASFVGSSVVGGPTQMSGSIPELHGNGDYSQTSGQNWYRHEI